jgi:Ca2+-binding EF-hand superfamily protein
MGNKGTKGSEIEKQLAKCMVDGAKEAKLKESFVALDKDNSGGLDVNEFKEFAAAYIAMLKKKLTGIFVPFSFIFRN